MIDPGFVVAAWLVIWDTAQHLPFATVEACRAAAELLNNDCGMIEAPCRRATCLPTGAE